MSQMDLQATMPNPADAPPKPPEKTLNEFKGVSVYDAETREFLFEFVPSLTMIKLVMRGKLFLIDVQTLAVMHQHGHRRVKANAVTQIKKMVEPV